MRLAVAYSGYAAMTNMIDNQVNPASAAPSRQSRITVWLTLLLLAALAWAFVVQQSETMGSANQAAQAMTGMDQSNQPAPGMADMNSISQQTQPAPASILVYLPVWVIMMVAMMFPAAIPIVEHYDAIQRSQGRRSTGQRAVQTWLFLAGYLAVWSLFGVGAYLLSLVLPALGMMAPGLRAAYPVAAGLILIGAGLYQLSPLKRACLETCRSPRSVLLDRWHDGYTGSFRMGIGQGVYCLGCSWALMLVLFVVGLMNLAGMVALSIVIFIEKVIPRGPAIGKLAALALMAFGLMTLLIPLLGQAVGAYHG